MGQHGSCIQGQPDWLGPYVKASGKNQEVDFYDKIRKLAAASSGSNDFYGLENFLSKVNANCPQHGLSTLPTISSKQLIPAANKFEELFYKENHCKDVNFSHDQNDNKLPSAKPVIVNRSTCKVHGNKTAAQVQQRSPACKVHGYQNSQISMMEDNAQELNQSKQLPPSYRYPPHPSSPRTKQLQPSLQIQEKSLYVDDEAVCDDTFTASNLSCPEFLMSLILPTDEPKIEDALASVGVQSAKEMIERLEDRAESIVETFGVVLKHLEHGDWSTFCISTSRLCDDIRRVLRDYHLDSEENDLNVIKIKNHVTSAMNQLTLSILSLSQNSANETNHHTLLPSFKNLGEVLHEMMEFLIKKELKVVVDCIHNGMNNACIQTAACALTEMSLSGELMCKLIIQAGAILPLLNVCKTKKYQHLWPLVLRTLTAICSVQTAVEEFEKLSGFNVILTIMDKQSDEKILCEAVGLLAQILRQWSENKYSVQKKIGHHINQLVKSLEGTAQKALSPEMFLLSAACLATLSFCNTDATNWLHRHAQEMRLLATNTKQESYV